MAESDLKIIENCSDDEKREHLHAMSKERLVELIIRLTRKQGFIRGGNISDEEKVNKIIEILQSPDLDDYECGIEIAKVVGIYNYEREDKRD